MQQLMLFDVQAHLLLPEHLMTYEPGFFSAEDSGRYLSTILKTIPFHQSKVMMYEKEVLTPRLSAWFGDRPIRDGDQRPPIKWTPELLEIKEKVEANTGTTFNGVLLNYYRDGNDSVAWHSDKDTITGLKPKSPLSVLASRGISISGTGKITGSIIRWNWEMAHCY